MDRISLLKQKVRTLPNTSGVYVMKDALGQVIYIGKASNLKRRVSHYFRKGSKLKAYNAKIASLSDVIDDFDIIKTKSDAEAVILESKLIKQWKPRYNTLEKDNKNFLHLRVETFSPLPRFTFSRNRKEDNSLYFGPYLGTSAIRNALQEVKKKFGILLSDAHPKKLPDGTWQLYDDARSEISKFPNIVSENDYVQRVQKALEYLKGRDEVALEDAREKMEKASAELEFEKAAKYRDLINAICETSKANARGNVSADISRTPEHIALQAMQQLCKILKIESAEVIECFDISHISGSFCVASMVHFECGEPVKQKYRRFKIKSFVGNDDYRAMHEVVTRRYKRLYDEKSNMPNIVLIDGGKGQVFSAMKAFDEARIPQPFIIGLAEKEETIVLEDFSEIKLPKSNEGLKLLQRVRDEAHRFANSFSAFLRSQKIRESILDDFKPLGKKRKEAILKHFGSIAKVKTATISELRQVDGIGFETALALRNFLDANFPNSVKKYRGRIAPTPSGLLHIGHANTFKIAQQRAKQNNGDLILRIEDIDTERCSQQFIDEAIKDLNSINIICNEGYNIGGKYAPYQQSKRTEFYWKIMQELITKKVVYPSTASRSEIKSISKFPNRIFSFCQTEPIFPTELRNLNFDLNELENPRLINWRFKVPDNKPITFKDNRTGEHTFVAGEDFGDFLVWRKADAPSYELAVVADDHDMQVTEVVRGEDLLLSTARQILIYNALGWDIPEFYHCKLVKDEEGNKISKSSLQKAQQNKWLIRSNQKK
ncbi:MAG: UvrB/UvrC motif-containing protein [Opitutales bacterium]|nr:UvrB/UvrC motif-containing protein [Opitutales bacterium]